MYSLLPDHLTGGAWKEKNLYYVTNDDLAGHRGWDYQGRPCDLSLSEIVAKVIWRQKVDGWSSIGVHGILNSFRFITRIASRTIRLGLSWCGSWLDTPMAHPLALIQYLGNNSIPNDCYDMEGHNRQ